MKLPPALEVGELIRFDEGGVLYEVMRSSPCAAYVRKVYDPPRVEVITRKDGTTESIRVHHGPVEPGISVHAFVIREGRVGKAERKPAKAGEREQGNEKEPDGLGAGGSTGSGAGL